MKKINEKITKSKHYNHLKIKSKNYKNEKYQNKKIQIMIIFNFDHERVSQMTEDIQKKLKINNI